MKRCSEKVIGNVLVPLLLAVAVKVRACQGRTETQTAGIGIPGREVSGHVVCWRRNIGSNRILTALLVYDSV